MASSDPMLGSVSMFAGNFAPRGWSFCSGQLLSINQNSALFSLIGTTYGGDGRTTFGLPDLRGRAAIGQGTGPGLSPRPLGQRSGAQTHTLSILEMPAHNHLAQTTVTVGIGANSGNATIGSPTNGSTLATPGALSGRVFNNTLGYNNEAPDVTLGGGNSSTASTTVSLSGNSQAFNIMQPYLAINYIIALVGFFPSRN